MRVRRVGRRKNPRHPVADFQVSNACSDRLNDARAFAPECLGQVALIESAAQLRIEKIYAGGFHLDQHLACAGLWQRQFFEPHRVDAAKFVHSDGFHRGLPTARDQRETKMKSSASGVALKYASRNSDGSANLLCRIRRRMS